MAIDDVDGISRQCRHCGNILAATDTKCSRCKAPTPLSTAPVNWDAGPSPPPGQVSQPRYQQTPPGYQQAPPPGYQAQAPVPQAYYAQGQMPQGHYQAPQPQPGYYHPGQAPAAGYYAPQPGYAYYPYGAVPQPKPPMGGLEIFAMLCGIACMIAPMIGIMVWDIICVPLLIILAIVTISLGAAVHGRNPKVGKIVMVEGVLCIVVVIVVFIMVVAILHVDL